MPKKKKSFRREVIEVIAAFFIAWLAYQVISAVAGTPLPIVSVVSDSMYHGPNNYGTMCGTTPGAVSGFEDYWSICGGYYDNIGITGDEFRRFTNPNGLSRGDLLFVMRPDNPRTGDILIYRKSGSDFTIVHRLIETNDGFYITKGENNNVADPPVAKNYVVGKVVFAVPILGYPRLLLHLIGI